MLKLQKAYRNIIDMKPGFLNNPKESSGFGQLGLGQVRLESPPGRGHVLPFKGNDRLSKILTALRW